MNHPLQTALMALALPAAALAVIALYELFSKGPDRELDYPARMCRPASKAKSAPRRKS